MRRRPAKRQLTIFMMIALLVPLLVACGGENEDEPDAAANTTSTLTANDVAQTIGTPSASEPPVTLPSEPETTVSGDVKHNPWGKVIPTGPAPTVPPNPPSDFDEDGDGLYTQEEFAEAIRYRYPEYEWPPNYQLDLDKAVAAMSYPEGSQIEAPGEYTFLGLYHQCAWEFTFLDAVYANDQGLIEESRHQLVDIGQKKNPLSRDETGKAMMRDFYDRAALGDPADLQQWVDNNCDLRKKNFITPDVGTPVAITVSAPGPRNRNRTRRA